ncbi:RNA polymerase sigma factor [Microbacterium sp. AG790]|uniref:RNA polymerase sigma factor n=1 Tax=Microbacterium sp. AG790 TaxID=2183995 RepID=UPI0015FF1A82|nr:sigma-70 family RNA polymerase sigma factor [Microbacterium sp. AG790]
MNVERARTQYPQLDDEQLIACVRTGDSSAVAELFLRHGGAAQRVALSVLRSAADAEDVAVDSFHSVVTAIENGNGPAVHFRAYLFTAVRNRSRAVLQERARVQPTDDNQILDSIVPDATESINDEMRAAFGDLPSRWQDALWFSVIQGEPRATTAERMGLSPNSFTVLLRRAKQGLRASYLSRLASSAEEPARSFDASARSATR